MIETLTLFRPLNTELIDLLRKLEPADWNIKTVAGSWTVKDVAAHLLDGSVRAISLYRDNQALALDEPISSYRDLVDYLNRLNAEWVKAYKRVSAERVLHELEETHEPYIQCLESLDLHAPAKYSVAWAGEQVSTNWFHIAREFTEKWHHQQQIRDAVGQTGILTKLFYPPVLETFMKAMPHQYRNTQAREGTVIEIHIESDAGGNWFLQKTDESWKLIEKNTQVNARVSIPANISWKLFTKAVRYLDVKDSISISGDEKLTMPVLQMLTVMA